MAISHCYCYSLSRQINWQSSYVVGFHSTPADHLAPVDHLPLHCRFPPLKWQFEIHTDIFLLWQLRQAGKCQFEIHTDIFLLWQLRQIKWQIYPPKQQLEIHTPINWAQMPWVPLHQPWHIYWQIYPLPLSIEHRCLEYCYTKLGRSTGRSTPQSSIDALITITPNVADLPPINHA